MLNRFQKHEFFINLNKCKWHTNEMNFLNYIILFKNITIQKNKIKVIRNWFKFQSINDIQQFVDLINFYRRFIRNFNHMTISFISILKSFEKAYKKNKDRKRKRSRNRNFQRFKNFLTFEIVETFEILKVCFIEMSLLHHFYSFCRFRIKIDVFNKIIENVLIQFVDDEWHLIAYYFFKMNFPQCNYEIHDQKLLIIIETFKHWRHYLKNVQHEIFVLTNHHNLKKFMKITKLSSRQIRWIQELSRYNFRIDYRQNKKNSTNALFRRSNLMQKNENVREKNRRILYRFQKFLQLQSNNVRIMRTTCESQKKIERSKSQIVVQYNVDWRTLMIDEAYVI